MQESKKKPRTKPIVLQVEQFYKQIKILRHYYHYCTSCIIAQRHADNFPYSGILTAGTVSYRFKTIIIFLSILWFLIGQQPLRILTLIQVFNSRPNLAWRFNALTLRRQLKITHTKNFPFVCSYHTVRSYCVSICQHCQNVIYLN